MRKNKQILSAVLALAICLGLTTPAFAYDMGKAGERNVISAGYEHSAAVDSSGALWMWGANDSGQLGNGSTEDAKTPVKVLDNVTSVSCGQAHTAAIKTDGSLWMWGWNESGQLGNGSTEDAKAPVKVLDSVAAVSCGGSHTAAIKTDGSLWMWGGNNLGALGNGGTGNDYSFYGTTIQTVPVKVLDNVTAVSCGGAHTAAVKADGTLWTWGSNDVGQLGDNGGGDSNTPVKVLDNVTAVSCGQSHTAAIKADESLWTWGANGSGQVGNGEMSNAWTPFYAMFNASTVSCGGAHTAAISDGYLFTWGANGSGQLGNETTAYSKTPSSIKLDMVAVSCGNAHTMAVMSDGSLWTWGGSARGQLGNGGTGNAADRLGFPIQTVPQQITLGSGASVSLTAPSPAAPPTPSAPTTPAAPAKDAVLSPQKLAVDGKNVSCEKYNIGGSNYFKLRDLAYLLNGTGSQFGVGFDEAASTVSITTKMAYMPAGTELVVGADNSSTAQLSAQSILIDGAAHSELTVYNIGGSNFFQLRELGSLLGFEVDFDGDTNTAIVRSIQK